MVQVRDGRASTRAVAVEVGMNGRGVKSAGFQDGLDVWDEGERESRL